MVRLFASESTMAMPPFRLPPPTMPRSDAPAVDHVRYLRERYEYDRDLERESATEFYVAIVGLALIVVIPAAVMFFL